MADGSHERVREQNLPIAIISRIMKKALPSNGKIAKEAKETVQECVSEFISFVTCEASNKCQREKRKTINGDDLLWAIASLGFDDYSDPLKMYLTRYREMEGDMNGFADGAEASGEKDVMVGGQLISNVEFFNQALSYENSQVQHMFPMQGPE